MKKTLLMTTLIIGIAFSKNALAEAQNEDASGDDCGPSCHWEYTADTGVLTITGSGAVTHGNWPGMYVQSVEMSKGFTSIGGGALSGISLGSFTIPNSVTHIEEEAFSDSGFVSLTIPDSVTIIDSKAFAMAYIPDLTISDSIPLGDRTFSYLGDTTIHCQGNIDICRTKLETAGYTGYNLIQAPSQNKNKEVYNEKDGSYTIYDKDGNFLGFKGKRIYTLKEANAITKPSGNTVRIKYR